MKRISSLWAFRELNHISWKIRKFIFETKETQTLYKMMTIIAVKIIIKVICAFILVTQKNAYTYKASFNWGRLAGLEHSIKSIQRLRGHVAVCDSNRRRI